MKDNRLNFKIEFKAIHPLTEEILAFLKSQGPLAHDDFTAIASDLRQYASVQIHDKIVEIS